MGKPVFIGFLLPLIKSKNVLRNYSKTTIFPIIRTIWMGCFKLSKGGLTGTVVDLRILFGTALKAMASSILIAHNHPSGNLTPSDADRELTSQIIFATALKVLASGIVIAHNHPSGNLDASEEDLKLTKKIKEAGELLDVRLIDHLILGIKDDYSSFIEKGWL